MEVYRIVWSQNHAVYRPGTILLLDSDTDQLSSGFPQLRTRQKGDVHSEKRSTQLDKISDRIWFIE